MKRLACMVMVLTITILNVEIFAARYSADLVWQDARSEPNGISLPMIVNVANPPAELISVARAQAWANQWQQWITAEWAEGADRPAGVDWCSTTETYYGKIAAVNEAIGKGFDVNRGPNANFTNSLDTRNATFYVDAAMTIPITRPIAQLTATVTRGISGQQDFFYTGGPNREDEAVVSPYDALFLYSTNQETAGSSCHDYSTVTLYVGDTIKISDSSSYPNFSGHGGISQKGYQLQTEVDSALGNKFAGVYSATIRNGPIASVTFTVTPDMVGDEILLHYQVEDWSKIGTNSPDKVAWYKADGSPHPTDPDIHHNVAETGGRGVFNKYYYTYSGPYGGAVDAYSPGGFGGWGNTSSNGNHLVYGPPTAGFPFGVWSYFASMKIKVESEPTDVVKVFNAYDDAHNVIEHAVVTEQTYDSPYTISAGVEGFDVAGWGYYNVPKPDTHVNHNPADNAHSDADDCWFTMVDQVKGDENYVNRLQYGDALGDVVNTDPTIRDSVYILYSKGDGVPQQTDIVQVFDDLDLSGNIISHASLKEISQGSTYAIPNMVVPGFDITAWQHYDNPAPDPNPYNWADIAAQTLPSQGNRIAYGTSVQTIATQGNDTVYILYTRTPSGGGDPGTVTTSEVPTFWRNQPVGFAEVKAGSFSNDRHSEPWEVMNGVPTTETLYVNAGGTPVFLDIEARRLTATATRQYTGTEMTSCPGHTDSDGNTTECSIVTTSIRYQEVTWNFNTTYIESVTVNPLTGAHLENVDVFFDRTLDVPITGGVTVSAEKKLYQPTFGSNPDNNSFGFTDGLLARSGTSFGPNCTNANGNNAINMAKAMDRNNNVKAFVRSDRFMLTIDGVNYLVMYDADHATKKEASVEEGGTLSVDDDVFLPVSGNWSKTHHIKNIGYTGKYDSPNRNTDDRLRIYCENIVTPLHQTNGVFYFEPNNQRLTYGAPQELARNMLPEGNNRPTVRLNYVDYHHADSHYAGQSAHVPKRDGVNAVVFHNPITAQNVWVHDVPTEVLQDQRIKQQPAIESHPRAIDAAYPSRNYIDFDFKVTWGNAGSFGQIPDANVSQTNFGYRAGNGALSGYGRGVLNVTESGTTPSTTWLLGGQNVGNVWGFHGTYVPPPTTRSATAPASSGMDCSKWINAKYIRFNEVEVRWIDGGSADGKYYPAGTWIKLYDDNYQVTTGDPTEFLFHITSAQKDKADTTYDFLTEAINIGPHLRVMETQTKANTMWSGAQELVNSKRDRSGYVTEGGGTSALSAVHAVKNSTVQDVIGRIGNLIVDETNDPVWGTAFWKSGDEWLIENVVAKPKVTAVSKYFSLQYGMFEETNTNISTFNDRWGGLGNYHNATGRLGGLPIMRGSNTTPGFFNNMVRMGYDVQFSVQTLGDYDNEVHVIPDYRLLGDFPNSSAGFGLFAPRFSGGETFYDPYWWSSYNAYVNAPKYEHVLSHTLADPRAKVNEWEKNTKSYVDAKSTKRIYLGHPGVIVIPQELRTYLGTNSTAGNVGIGTSSPVGGTRYGRDETDVDTYRNVQRWHGRMSIPNNTLVALGDFNEPTWVKKKHNQYIAVFVTVRTNASNGLWDLTTKTNVASMNPVNGDPQIPVTVPDRNDNANTGFGSIGGLGRDGHRPQVPLVIFDYSYDASVDYSIIGTH